MGAGCGGWAARIRIAACCGVCVTARLAHSAQAVADRLPEVLDLCIYGCYKMTDEGLIGFKRGCCLCRLNTSGCYKITDSGTRYLIQVQCSPDHGMAVMMNAQQIMACKQFRIRNKT